MATSPVYSSWQKLALNDILEEMFMVLTDKEKEVLIRRYSLHNQPKETLEKIGAGFAVTRERVRQIENAALKKLRRTLDNTKLKEVTRVAFSILDEHDGLLLESKLIQKVIQSMPDVSIDSNIAKLALSIEEDIVKVKKNSLFKPAWRLDEVQERIVRDVIEAADDILKKTGDTLSLNGLVESLQKRYPLKASNKFVNSCLEISKLFKRVDEGWGLMEWRHINPKSIRDKAYIVLKQAQRPLHFMDIASKIIEAEFDHKIVTVQAVHNELIRGDHFVLVGRGLYALKEWGYVEGTVSDVIERILKKAQKPLPKSEIVKRVLAVRQVKIGTIALNLQKNPKFARVGRAVYEYRGA
ncbi:MAG: hypothetical protein HY817_03690 [Candidatus Abawacabacteria bacterium]|nr:hypothetical protein [Candidatus Abawacabacteria bacterium]